MLVVMAVVMTMLGMGLNVWAEQQAHARQRDHTQKQAFAGWHRVSVQLRSTYGPHWLKRCLNAGVNVTGCV